MTPFYMAMARSGNARKLYVQVWLICLLLFHYVYACGHMGEFGILLSTGVCAAMFSFRWTDNWLRRLLDRPGAFVTLASVALVIGFVPHLYTLAITITYLLLAALFYPSVRVMSECMTPHVGGDEQVHGGDWLAPRNFADGSLQPLGVLVQHGVPNVHG